MKIASWFSSISTSATDHVTNCWSTMVTVAEAGDPTTTNPSSRTLVSSVSVTTRVSPGSSTPSDSVLMVIVPLS